MTLRARLTLWYSAQLAGVLILFGIAAYLFLSYSLTRQAQQQLLSTADDISKAAIRTVRGVEFNKLAFDTTANVHVQLWDLNGELQGPQEPALEVPFDPAAFDQGQATFSRVDIESMDFQVLTYPLYLAPENELVGHLQLASPYDPVNQALESLLLFLVSGGALAVGIAAIVGWSFAGVALRPLERVTQAAIQITRADDLSRRIPLKGPPRGEVDRLVEAFNETLERLENLFETQRRFLADVSHELRTPLTTIRGNVDLLRRMQTVDEDSMEAISSEVDRMTRMVKDLLLLAQAETGKIPLAQDVIELDTLMLEVFKQVKVLSQNGIDVRLGREDQVRIRGDRDRIKQVLLNLVANAIDHTPSGGSITLGLACVDDWARLTVTDTGAGIPQDQLANIFERFYRIDPSRKRSAFGGTGLGLSIAYWITRSHQGRIEVASEIDHGTTFSVWLPRLEEDCGRRSLVETHAYETHA
jgi:signal transduction histidine kinase